MAEDLDVDLRMDFLRFLKLRALRSGAWYKALNCLDRALVNLTIRVAKRVQSLRLIKALLAVVNKLEEALENKISKAIRLVGFPLACKIGLLAEKWGNPLAESWSLDVSFARFLAIMYINSNRRVLI